MTPNYSSEQFIMHMNCTCMKRYRGRQEIECNYALAMGAYREDVIGIRWSKIPIFSGGSPKNFPP